MLSALRLAADKGPATSCEVVRSVKVDLQKRLPGPKCICWTRRDADEHFRDGEFADSASGFGQSSDKVLTANHAWA